MVSGPVSAFPLVLQHLVRLHPPRLRRAASSLMVVPCPAACGGDVLALPLEHTLHPEAFAASSPCPPVRDPTSQEPRGRDHPVLAASALDSDPVPWKDTKEPPRNGGKDQELRNAKDLSGTDDELPGTHPSAPRPSELGADDAQRHDDDAVAVAAAVAACRDGCRRDFHGESRAPGDGAMLGGAGESRIRGVAGSDRPDAIPVVSNRHCSPVLLGNCPPACLRRMRSARANRSGWEPGSEWKEFERLEPRGAAPGAVERFLRRERRGCLAHDSSRIWLVCVTAG